MTGQRMQSDEYLSLRVMLWANNALHVADSYAKEVL